MNSPVLVLGFKPAEFKSSRAEKGTVRARQPTDFMDEEDMGEFGIAPHKIQTKEDFATDPKKRAREKPSEGPIPGEPVLKNLLKPVHDKAAVRILKSMGWRDNQGIGSRLTYREKKNTNERNQREMYIQKKYGCDMGPMVQQADSDDDLSDDEITFAPDDFDPFIANIKNNSFGLGYSGLKPSSSGATSQHFNLFESFEVVDKNNKKLSIRGQAFGVGALEEEDDDIYEKDDMSRYDKSLDDAAKAKKRQKVFKADSSLVEGFSKASIADSSVRVFSIDLSRNFVPRNWLTRRSRFEPLDRSRANQLEDKSKHKVLGLGRHDLKPDERGALLNEKPVEPEGAKKPELEVAKNPEPEVPKRDYAEEKRVRIQESAKKITELLNSKQFVSENSGSFKPFMGNDEKQARYEKFLTLKSSNEKEVDKLLKDIQPLSMSSFHREMEKKEFMQAKRMYQPLDSLMANRFIKGTDVKKDEKLTKTTESGKEVLVIQRTKSMWKPHKDLCKRFNVPEPFGGMMFDEDEEKKRKKKSSTLFDYIGVPLNTKANFVTPQVIPRKMAVDDRKKNAEDEQRKSFLAAVEKEKSFMNADEKKRAAAKDFFEATEPSTSKVIPEKPREMQSKDVRIEPPVPRTELEIKVAESINKKPEDKKDLFRAIFCDSDDEDDPAEDEKANQEAAALSEAQKSTFIESFLNTKSASEINVLRNDEAPRGIFKSILQINPPVDVSKQNEDAEKPEGPAVDAYGPRLPDKPLIPTAPINDSSSSSNSDLDEKILKKLKKTKKVREEWVEKDKVKSKKSHKHKKEHKKKHKKHKSRK